ncbi:hypothetical protein TNCV_4173531 [Trichonephila clavipes]|nr:hypothetical protein TNCV_4173531 [Trichonephila clavipes]
MEPETSQSILSCPDRAHSPLRGTKRYTNIREPLVETLWNNVWICVLRLAWWRVKVRNEINVLTPDGGVTANRTSQATLRDPHTPYLAIK